jgi:hypothetical protein
MRCDKKQPSNLGSSETTREAPLFKNQFDFSLYFQNALPDHIKITDVKFLQWFLVLVKVMVLLLFLKPIVALL